MASFHEVWKLKRMILRPKDEGEGNLAAAIGTLSVESFWEFMWQVTRRAVSK